MAPSLLDRSFRYVPSKDMGPDYLANKFKAMIRKQKLADQKPVVEPVGQIIRIGKGK